MKKLLILLSGLLLLQTSCSHTESAPGTRAERVVSEIHNPASKKVLVACHRGDWRNWPENSLAILTQPRLYWFPIGTISKVKKIVRFCDDKIIKARSAHQIYLYVLQHIF